MKADTINLTLNVNSRTETLNGKRHLVVPAVILTEGVHNRFLYPAEELKRTPEAWNGIPVPVEHPMRGGVPSSVNLPEIIERSIGRIFNTSFDDGKLKTEIWIDAEKALKRYPEVLDLVQSKNARLEVSTALFMDEDRESGIWKGEIYEAIARNYRPDHLALLPYGRGACSWEDGCGIRANQKRKEDKMRKDYSVNSVGIINERTEGGFGVPDPPLPHWKEKGEPCFRHLEDGGTTDPIEAVAAGVNDLPVEMKDAGIDMLVKLLEGLKS